MTDVRKRIEEVLKRGHLLSLATVDDGGPWVGDMIYIHDDDLNLYWISRKNRRHSIAIRANPQVAASITVSEPKGNDLGLQISGLAEELSDNPAVVDAYWKKRGKPPQRPITDEHAWYILKLTKIELIDEEHFGHEKKVLKP